MHHAGHDRPVRVITAYRGCSVVLNLMLSYRAYYQPNTTRIPSKSRHSNPRDVYIPIEGELVLEAVLSKGCCVLSAHQGFHIHIHILCAYTIWKVRSARELQSMA